MKSDWTYFVQSKHGGPIKIGYTSQEPKARLAGLQTGSPVELQLVGLLRGNVELELHSNFSADRIHGEWFNPSQSIRRFIKNHCQEELADLLSTERLRFCAAVRQPSPKFGRGFFDVFIENNEDTLMSLMDVIDWDEGVEYETDEDYDGPSSPTDVITDIALCIHDCSFFEGVGINNENNWLCLVCNSLNSGSRAAKLTNVLGYAVDLAEFDSRFHFFATAWYLGKQTGFDYFSAPHDNKSLVNMGFDLEVLIDGR